MNEKLTSRVGRVVAEATTDFLIRDVPAPKADEVVIRIKAMAKRANISRLDAGPKGATVQFHGDKFPNPAGLVEFLTDQHGQAKVEGNKIVIRRDWSTDAERVKGAYGIARDLAAKAKG